MRDIIAEAARNHLGIDDIFETPDRDLDATRMHSETMELQKQAEERYKVLHLLLEQTLALPPDHPVKKALFVFMDKECQPILDTLDSLNFDDQIMRINQLIDKLIEIRKNAGVADPLAK